MIGPDVHLGLTTIGSRYQHTPTAHRGCVHLIIDTEDTITVNAAPAEREGNSHEDHSHPLPDSGEPAERAAAAAFELLQEELLPRLFPGVAPQLPLQSPDTASSSAITTVMVQLQQSIIITLQHEGQMNDSAEMNYCNASHAPPTVVGVSPAAVCCQSPSLPPLASPTEAASDCITISGRITVWLQLSAPLPSEGVTLLARYRGGFLEARFEQADDNDGALIIKVRAM